MRRIKERENISLEEFIDDMEMMEEDNKSIGWFNLQIKDGVYIQLDPAYTEKLHFVVNKTSLIISHGKTSIVIEAHKIKKIELDYQLTQYSLILSDGFVSFTFY